MLRKSFKKLRLRLAETIYESQAAGCVRNSDLPVQMNTLEERILFSAGPACMAAQVLELPAESAAADFRISGETPVGEIVSASFEPETTTADSGNDDSTAMTCLSDALTDLAPAAPDSLACVPKLANVEEAASVAAGAISHIDLATFEKAPLSASSAPGRSDSVSLVVVDSAIEDVQFVVAELEQLRQAGRAIQIQLLEAGRDGIDQVTESLRTLAAPVDSVHFLTHATDRAFQLGSTWIDSAGLLSRQSQIASWSGYLSPGADLVFYGCDLAAGFAGQTLLTTIADWTGADLAASSNATGSEARGGDWNFEFQIGDVTSTAVVSSEFQSRWQGLLAAFTVTNTSDSGAGSLRQAILNANSLAGTDTITFNISGTGPHTIDLMSALPTLTDSVVIDGWTEPDFSGTPVIVLNGSLAGSGANGLTLTAGNSTVRGLVFSNFGNHGIHISGGDGNTIEGNYFGVDETGAIPQPLGGHGIEVTSGSNTIGGTSALAGNVIAFNGGDGIRISGPTTFGNAILGNSMYSNAGLGIDLAGDGVTLNDLLDSDVGPNHLQNFPVLSLAVTDGIGSVWVNGLMTGAANTLHRLEFFAGPGSDPSGYGEGRTFLGAVDVTTNALGTATFAVSLRGVVGAGEFISATATNLSTSDTSEFSLSTVAAVSVATNTAPVLATTTRPPLAPIAEDAGPPTGAVGTLVSDLVDLATPAGQLDNVTDPDSGAQLGIALIATSSANGSWWYTTNGGSSWSAIGSVSSTSARLLAADANTRIWFHPAADFNGTIADAITFRAWDQTTGGNGVLVDASVTGGSTAFSADLVTADQTIVPVNDEQSITTNLGATILEGATGTVITSAMLKTSDVDNSAVEVVYTMTLPPAAGTLFRAGVALGVSDSFTQLDIDSGLITYSHDGSIAANISFSFTVDDGTGSVSVGVFVVTVIPVNNPPVITSNGGGDTAGVAVPENGTAVTTVTATDSDLPVQLLLYSIIGGSDAAHFSIDLTGGQLSFVTPRNFESPQDADADNVYEVIVQVTDALGGTDVQRLLVTVLDVDEFDVSIVADSDSTADSVDENSAPGTVVGITASASDSDGTNNTITYSLDDTAGGRFAIDSVSGVITVAGSLDREQSASYTIRVRATSADGSTTNQSFTIAIRDIDESPVTVPADTDPSPNAVLENAASGTPVGITVSASDSDATNNTITYSLDDDAGGRFAIDSVSGVITVAGSLDREQSASYTIRVRAMSADGSTATQSFSIAIEDVNELPVSAPADADQSLNVVAENAANGTQVGITASAFDGDATNNAITYSLDNDSGGRFAIDSTSGIVTVANGTLLDYEANSSHLITVRALSADGSARVQIFIITVTDQNEAPVGISISGGVIAENSGGGTFVAQVTGTDADGADPLTYFLVNDAGGRFAIDSLSGRITVKAGAALNYESSASHGITVRVRDSGGLELESSFTVTVTDVNEAPVASGESYTLWLPGSLDVTPGGLLANDADEDGDVLQVVLVSGTISGTLVLNPDGSFRYTPPSDFRGTDSFVYQVTDGTWFSDAVTVTMNVLPGTPTPPTNGNGGSGGGGVGGGNGVPTTNNPAVNGGGIGTGSQTSYDSGVTTYPGGAYGRPSSNQTSSRPSRGGGSGSGNEDALVPGDRSVRFPGSSGAGGSLPGDHFFPSFRTGHSESAVRVLRKAGFSGLETLIRQTLWDSETTANLSDVLISTIFSSGDFADSLIQAETQNDVAPAVEKVAVGVCAFVSTGLSVGYAIWILRGGSLLATFVSSIPLWKSFDPLPVLDCVDDQVPEDPESLLSIATGEESEQPICHSSGSPLSLNVLSASCDLSSNLQSA